MARMDFPPAGPADDQRRAAALRATVLIAWARAAFNGLLFAAALLAFGWPDGESGRASASVVKALSLEQLTAKADEILVALPTERRARRHVDGKMIVTDVDLRVEQVLKGQSKAGQIARATVLGGKLEGVALQVPGEANFAIGQRVLVFLQRSPRSNDLRVVGMSQGVLPVREQDGTTMVLPGVGAALVERGEDGTLQDAQPALRTPEPLPALLQRIRALVAAGR